MSQDFYEILQVHPHADQDAIKAAYERLSTRYDPARLEGMADELLETARQRYAQLQDAYTTLNDPQRRAAYDQRRETGHGGGGALSYVATTDKPVLDYRPLPPAAHQERPRHFDAQPQQPDDSGTGRARFNIALMVAAALIVFVLGLSISLSGGLAQFTTAAVPPTVQPAAANPEDTGFDRYEAVISAARQATQQNPDDLAAWVNYANALYDSVQIVLENEPNGTLYKQRMPRWLEASQAYSQALKLQGDQPNPLLLSDRGASLCYYGKGIADQKYVAQGLSDTRTAAAAAPNESLVLFNYGNCLISDEPPQVAEASAQWQRILEVTPADSPIAARARELLTQYAP